MLLCVSASHKTASFELLEQLSAHTSALGPAIVAQGEPVQGAVVVSTCNRFEAYVDMAEPLTPGAGVEATLQAIGQATGVPASSFDGSYRVVEGNDVAQHLFSVASGLESVVVGEGEIAGQVRRALKTARHEGTTTPELERLFQRASETQRGVKNATALGRAGRSLVRLSLELADSRVADWTALRVLLVGTGSYAAATLAALRDHGARDITVFSPSGRGERFALKHQIAVSTDLRDAVASADLVITCTSDLAITADVIGKRAPGLIIDLGMPRNVDPAVAAKGVALLDLELIRLHAPLDELQATDAARQVVLDAARRFTVLGEHRNVAPAVVALRRHVFGVLDAEIDRARGKGDDGRIEQALRHMVGVLLHTPSVRAQELAEQGHADRFTDAIATLFGAVPDEDAESDEGSDTAASA
ncbi:glutamyl-tRNA reductase [Microbacterium mangrovi]|uniref:Glutamyl-tRNA reductase n=1 Tax=Microbacterium mangrovi TaxID=1348253 RepID=A0A0B2ADL4_9MICO|nr:glutamyl-tRNA reductase [Microbacterium mangrovi]KHK99795.1 glutamyl-tRNA reductase [Microbacterium mangrovi]